MDSVQERLFELIKEVKGICDENNLHCYLHGKLLNDAFDTGEITGNYNEFSLLMDAADIGKFIEIVKKTPDRALDYLGVNPNYKGFSMNYVDTTTLYFRTGSWGNFKYPGFSVTIEPLRMAKSLLGSKIDSMIIKGHEIDRYNREAKNKSEKIGKIVYDSLGIVGRAERSKIIFDMVVLNGTGSKRYYEKPNSKKRIKISEEERQLGTTTSINGVSFNYLNNKKYTKLIKETYRRKEMTYNGYIIDENCPMAEFLAELEMTGVDIKQAIKDNIKLQKVKKEINRYRKYVQECWNLLYRTRDRFEMMDFYEPIKKEVFKAYEDNDIEKLGDLLKENIEMMDKYEKENLGFAFDPTIFSITLDYISKTGDIKKAQRYAALVPKEHLIPLSEIK